MTIEVILPKMTDHMEAAEVVRWLVQEGDQVEAHQPILEVMTDKVTAEVEAPASGVLRGIRPGVDVGAVVPVGSSPVGLDERTLALRPTMALTLTVDHRAVDGFQAAAFLRDLKARIEAASAENW